MQLSKKGIASSVLSSVLFAALPACFLRLAPLTSIQVLALRVFWTLIVMIIFLIITRQATNLRISICAVLRKPKVILLFTLCAIISVTHQGFFVWAPTHGAMLDVSMGYFLSPLVLIMIGRFFYKEQLSILQVLAVIFAAFGVLHELWTVHALSWITTIIATTYPIYLTIRRKMQLSPVIGYLIEMFLLSPLIVGILIYANPLPILFQDINLSFWLILIGIMTAAAFVMLICASQLLPFSLLGILSYLEPGLLFAFSLIILKEPITQNDLWTYIPIIIAIFFVIIDSVRILLRQMHRTKRSISQNA